MNHVRNIAVIFFSGLLVVTSSGTSLAQNRAPRAIEKNDKDGDGRVSRDEWGEKRRRIFNQIDTDGDGYLTLEEFRAQFGETADSGSADKETVLAEGQVKSDDIDAFTLCAMGRGFDCTMEPAIERGLFETGLNPRFPDNAICRAIDEGWAISYTAKRNRDSYHGGIDMPAPWGTPMIAAADGVVIGKYLGEKTPRGIEIVLRHRPEDTGLPVWTFTQYTHFSEMPKQELGQRVRKGEVLGPTGNSGINVRTGRQSERRRPAIHFAVFFNTSGNYAALSNKIIPVEGWWMDPNAMFRKKPPFDSGSLKALPQGEKKIPISVMFEDGATDPADTRIIWPYTCRRR